MLAAAEAAAATGNGVGAAAQSILITRNGLTSRNYSDHGRRDGCP
jgi:hypothetical protein